MANESTTTTNANNTNLTITEALALAGGIGGGIGADIAIASGAAVGTAAITVWGAAAVGVGATIIASVEVGTVIGNIPFVRDNLQSAVEYFFPTEPPRGDKEIQWPDSTAGSALETITEIGCFPILLPLGG